MLVRNDFDSPSSVDRLSFPARVLLGLNDEGGHALGARVAVGLREQHADVGLVGDRRPHLLTVDAVDVAVAPREGLHVAFGIGAAARLGERHHADGLAGDQVRHVLLDLLGRAAEVDAARTGGALLVVARGEAHIVAHRLLLDDGGGQVAHVAAAHRLGEHRAVQARFASLPDELARKLAARLEPVHDGDHFGLHEAVDHVAYRFDLGGHRRIHDSLLRSLRF